MGLSRSRHVCLKERSDGGGAGQDRINSSLCRREGQPFQEVRGPHTEFRNKEVRLSLKNRKKLIVWL